jgi:hypothetical protein
MNSQMFVFPKFVPILHKDVLWKTRAQSSYQVHVNAGKSNSRPSDYKLSDPTKGLASRLSFSVSRQDSLQYGISMYWVRIQKEPYLLFDA